MITSLAIFNFLKNQNELLSDFPLLQFRPKSSTIQDFLPALYVPNLDFELFRKNLVKYDLENKVMNNNSNWIGIMWNRGLIRNDESLPRVKPVLKKNLDLSEASKYQHGLVTCDLEMQYVCSNLELEEDLEEFLTILPYRKTYDIQLDFFPDQNITVTVHDHIFNSFEKLETETMGTLAQISSTATLRYPVFIERQQVKLISQIQTFLFANVYGEENWDIFIQVSES